MVSVVLTTYNRASVLEATIRSIVDQSFCDLELLISDDASRDDTQAVCESWVQRDERIQYFRQSENVGMPRNLITAIQNCSGTYVANLHDGDIYSPRLIEAWVNALESCRTAGFVFNAYAALTEDGSVEKVFKEDLPACGSGAELHRLFFRRWRFDSPVWGTAMVRRSAYEAVGLFEPKFGFCSDIDMWLRLANSFDVAYVSEPLISLPAREALPRIGQSESPAKERRLIRTMFLNARRTSRHLSSWRRRFELVVHILYVGADESLRAVLTLRRWTRDRLSP